MVEMQFGELGNGFFLRDGQLYFGMIHGRYTFPFPVVDGEIQNRGNMQIHPGEMVNVLTKEEWPQFGVTERTVTNFAQPSEASP